MKIPFVPESQLGGTSEPASGNLLTVGQETLSRHLCSLETIVMASQRVDFSFLTARKSETVVSLRTSTGAAAATGATLAKMGLYSVAANGDLTLIGSTASDTALFTATYTAYTKALSASVAVTQGSRYAFARLIVTAGTLPQFVGNAWGGAGSEVALTPVVSASLAAQADLPASVASASLAGYGRLVYGVLVP